MSGMRSRFILDSNCKLKLNSSRPPLLNLFDYDSETIKKAQILRTLRLQRIIRWINSCFHRIFFTLRPNLKYYSTENLKIDSYLYEK